MRERSNVCSYLDIALQHVSCIICFLKNYAKEYHQRTNLRFGKTYTEEVPGIHLRTTMLAGHPGETEEDIEELKAFMKFARFERLGAFTYSNEEGTHAYKTYEDNIPEDVKQEKD